MQRLVKTTYLKMTHAREAKAFDRPRQLDVIHAEIPSPELSRFFYVSVGSDWFWYDRLSWSRAKWLEVLERPGAETWVAYLSGTPVGYFELVAQSDASVELVYFGLLPAFIGRGLGSELLKHAIERAWQLGPDRVWLHTCSLDHPRALALYESHGFVPYKTDEQVEELPDAPLGPWPDGERSGT